MAGVVIYCRRLSRRTPQGDAEKRSANKITKAAPSERGLEFTVEGFPVNASVTTVGLSLHHYCHHSTTWLIRHAPGNAFSRQPLKHSRSCGTSVSREVNQTGGDYLEPVEIIFEVTEAPEGGFDARAPGRDIFTQGEDWADLKEMVRDAIRCHFDDKFMPRTVRVHLVRDELIAV